MTTIDFDNTAPNFTFGALKWYLCKELQSYLQREQEFNLPSLNNMAVNINYNTKYYAKEGTISAPTFSQAFRWFREKHKLLSYIDKCLIDTFRYNIDYNNSIIGLSGHTTYEEAELACIIKLIEIVKNRR